MGASSRANWGVVRAAAVVLVIGLSAFASPATAIAAPLPALSVGGKPLGTAPLPSGAVSVSVNAPVGVSVKFKLDGRYLGEDPAWPFSWPITAGPGEHKMEARWDSRGRQEIKTTFTVGPAASAPPTKPAQPTPAVIVQPTTPVSGVSTPVLSVDGGALAGSSQPSGSFVVAVNAPKGATVKFKIDGTYLGQDSTPPYMWPISAGDGSHEIDARWSGARTSAEFQVAARAPTAPKAAAGVRVATSAELTAALTAARPGQTIHLADGSYVGRFASAASGTAAAPITLSGSRKAILSTGSLTRGYGLHLTGSHWVVNGISVTRSGKGIVLDGSKHTTIRSVDVGHTGAEAVHFRANSSDGVIENSVIHDTGLDKPAYGEGIYIGSATSNWKSIMGSASVPDQTDRIVVRNNRISNTTAEGVDVKEGTTGGSLINNVFSNAGHSGQNFADSWVDVKGNGYRVTGNSGAGTKLDAFQVHGVLPGWGTDNTFSDNSVAGGVPGYEVWVQSGPLRTIVSSGSSGAARGMSNVPCVT